MQNIDLEIQKLIDILEHTQYTHKPINPPKTEIMTKLDLQKIIIPDGVPVSRTSGSTGFPVIVPKNMDTYIWFAATNMRELQWRKWDLSLKRVSILAKHKEDKVSGNIYIKTLDPISILQKYLEDIQPNYIYTYPTIIERLDLTKLTKLVDIKSTGEPGGTCYSCEEAGTIALQCPDNKEIYHIMENIIVESDNKYGAVITDLCNPLITRYALGDVIELGNEPCGCGRTLSTIKKIFGRVRNMLILPDGDRIWPTTGELTFYTITDKIIRHQVIQKTLYSLEARLQVKNILTNEEEIALVKHIIKKLKYDHLDCYIVYVDEFPLGKFEAFKCEL